MENTGSKLLVFILSLLLIFARTPLIFCEPEGQAKIEIIEIPGQGVHERMLEKLKIEPQKEPESFFRRGEITFFISFGYLWMYQFILYDQVMSGVFSEPKMDGELSDRNLYFAVITSLVLALFVARNDLQHTHYLERGRFFQYQKAPPDPAFDRTKKGYNWYFDLFSWEF